MSMPSPNPSGGPRMSRGIKLVLMGVAGAALLYSCAPAIDGRRRASSGSCPGCFAAAAAAVTAPGNAGPDSDQANARRDPHPATTQSQRGGFGSTGSTGGSSGSS